MNWLEHLEPQNRTRHIARLKKKTRRLLARPVPSTPVFLFGKQRSGTTMLMTAFHFHPDTEVFDEHGNNKAFLDFRIRSLDTLAELVKKSKAPVVCFKPISDSHLIQDFARAFPEGRFIWIYRDYRDSAASALRKFPHATRAIKLICEGKEGGGWFQESVSEENINILQDVYKAPLSEFDLACLVWWARNKLFTETKVSSLPHWLLLKYEPLVTEPRQVFDQVFDFIGLPHHEDAYQFVHSDSIKRHEHPDLNPEVANLCDTLTQELDELFSTQS